MRGYVRLLRPLNAAMSAVGVLLGSLVAVGSFDVPWLVALQAAAVALLFTAAGNALNDYHDRDVDALNRPERPLPAGEATPRGALALAVALFVPTVPWSLLLGWELLLVVAANLALMSSYEVLFKREGFRGNLLISWLVASLFLFGGLAVYQGAVDALLRVLLLALLAFLATLGREIIKDIEDVGGDVGRWTLPMILGETRAGRVAAGVLLAAVALSALPAALRVLNLWYVAPVLVADGIFIYAALHASRDPAAAQRAAKYAMLSALVAFLVGGLP